MVFLFFTVIIIKEEISPWLPLRLLRPDVALTHLLGVAMRQSDHHSLVPARTQFHLGQVLVTEKACQLDPAIITDSLHRHARGDFGPFQGFQALNNRALRKGGDIISAYIDPRSDRFFLVVTAAHKRRTVVMLSEEYNHAQRLSVIPKC